jgi:hypothetical protein
LTFVKILIYYLLLVGNITTAARVRIFVICLGVFSVVCVSLAVLQYHDVLKLPQPEPELVLDALGRPQTTGKDKDAFVTDKEYDPVSGQMVEFKRLRGVGIFADPNDLSLLLTLGIFIAMYGLSDAGQGIFRMAWLGPLVFLFYALLLTYSRAGMLSLLIGCSMLLGARYGWRMLLLALPLLPVGMLLAGGRMGSFSASEGTGQARVQIWSDSLEQFRASPLFGVGYNEVGTAVGRAAHNSFLNAYVELGLFGGSIFFAAFFFAFFLLLNVVRYRAAVADASLRRLLPCVLAAVTAYIIGIMTLSRTDTVTTYMLLGLVTASTQVATERAPQLALRIDGRVLQRLALGNVGMILAVYLFVRVFRS